MILQSWEVDITDGTVGQDGAVRRDQRDARGGSTSEITRDILQARRSDGGNGRVKQRLNHIFDELGSCLQRLTELCERPLLKRAERHPARNQQTAGYCDEYPYCDLPSNRP